MFSTYADKSNQITDTELGELLVQDERDAVWNIYYYSLFETLASKDGIERLKKFWEHPKLSYLNEELKNQDAYKLAVKTLGQMAADKAMIQMVNNMVAKEIAISTVKGVVSQTGRRGAVVLVDSGAKLAAARGANVALTGVTSLGLGITAAVGEMVGNTLYDGVGLDNHHLKNIFGVGGSIGGGAFAGACVAGPVGALAGAGIGAISWGVGQTFQALTNCGKGPNDNWLYVEVGNIGDNCISIGSYAHNDSIYAHTYDIKYYNTDTASVISAGQPCQKPFQVTVWHGRSVLVHFKTVHYRDLLRVIKKDDKFVIFHGKGELHEKESGTTDVTINGVSIKGVSSQFIDMGTE
jgi:hypothetical protein